MQAMIASAGRDIEAFMRNDVMTIPCKEDTTILYATFAAMNQARLPRVILKIRIRKRSFLMKRMIGAAVVAGALASTGPAAVNPAVAAPQTKAQTAGVSSDTTDFSARRNYRRYYRYGYYRPYYYARPCYYRPYPYYAPTPFVFGFGFGPFW
jgi:hypothetical protein